MANPQFSISNSTLYLRQEFQDIQHALTIVTVVSLVLTHATQMAQMNTQQKKLQLESYKPKFNLPKMQSYNKNKRRIEKPLIRRNPFCSEKPRSSKGIKN